MALSNHSIREINCIKYLDQQNQMRSVILESKQFLINRKRVKKTITHAKRFHYKTIFNNVKHDTTKT